MTTRHLPLVRARPDSAEKNLTLKNLALKNLALKNLALLAVVQCTHYSHDISLERRAV